MHIAVIPIVPGGFIWNPDAKMTGNSEAGKFLKDYNVIVFPGKTSGYVVETAEKSIYPDIDVFAIAIRSKTRLDLSNLTSKHELNYVSLNGQKLKMIYNPSGLRCTAWIDGKKQDWDNHTAGAVYDSPWLKIKNGVMKVSDG
ncbi:MAG: hypothetical protein HC830_13125, partial [Bacteroidetes bacterium]|nr:hypothetical protein [Bacteroidota bacterium]